jgi:hypothetical protein
MDPRRKNGTEQLIPRKTGKVIFPERAPIRPTIMVKLTAIVLKIIKAILININFLLTNTVLRQHEEQRAKFLAVFAERVAKICIYYLCYVCPAVCMQQHEHFYGIFVKFGIKEYY